MKFLRRQFLHFAAGAAALPAVLRVACADLSEAAYHDDRAVPPGGGVDALARVASAISMRVIGSVGQRCALIPAARLR